MVAFAQGVPDRSAGNVLIGPRPLIPLGRGFSSDPITSKARSVWREERRIGVVFEELQRLLQPPNPVGSIRAWRS
jgi:hypothetical protein